uniref:J domain-containing protein n=1 Tax=Panagrolaimus sp. JU765 TaxID=591449 RepID=A0AC34QNQ7_9BILA
MDESLGYDDEQEKHFIGNLLNDDDSFSPNVLLDRARRQNIQQHSGGILPSQNPISWTEPLSQFQQVQPLNNAWNNSSVNNGGYDFFFKSTSFASATHPNYSDFTRNSTVNTGTGQTWQVKPMAAVPPFYSTHSTNLKIDSALNSFSNCESQTCDSGTVSPELKSKVKWKKVDLGSGDVNESAARQNNESNGASTKSYSFVAQQSNGTHHKRSYSFVAQQSNGTHHKRVSGSNSVPLQKLIGNEKSLSTKDKTASSKSNSRVCLTQPATPEEAAPKNLKIVGLNPVCDSVSETSVKSLTPTSGSSSSTNISTNQGVDFQKIKSKKKKNKAAGTKSDSKIEADQKMASRYSALVEQQHQKVEVLEDGLSDDDDLDDSEYLRQVEEQKEEIRARTRAELAAQNSTDAERAARMQKLEIDMRAMFSMKRRNGKLRNTKPRIKSNNYNVVVPEYFKSLFVFLSKVACWVILFIWHLVCDVAERSLIAGKAFQGKVFEWMVFCFGVIGSFCQRFLTEVADHLRYAAIDDTPIYKIGLSENVQLPIYCEDVLERLYHVQNSDAYSILGLTKDCSNDEIKKYYDKMIASLNTDSLSNVGLDEAKQLIESAYEFVSTSTKRERYDLTLGQLPQTYELQRDLDDFRALINSRGAILHCECGDNHPIIRYQHHRGRYCLKDNAYHQPKNGDIWIEKRCFGLLRVFFAAINGAVYDVTKWCECSANAIPHFRADLHNPAYRLYNNGSNSPCLNNGGTAKHRCSTQKSEGQTEWCIFGQNTTIPVENLCCCNLAFCSIPDNVVLRNIPCCFGANLAAYNTVSTSNSGEKSDQARRAGRRRKFR